MSRIKDLTERVESLEYQSKQKEEYLYKLMGQFDTLLDHMGVKIEKPIDRWSVKEKHNG